MEISAGNSKKVTVNPSVVFTDLDDGSAVLLHLDSKFYYSLNETGTFLWQTLENEPTTSMTDLVGRVCERFKVEEGEAKNDLDEFLDSLKKEGLIEIDN